MLLCKAIPTSFDFLIQLVAGFGCIHLFFRESGFDVLGMLSERFGVPFLLEYVALLTAIAGGYLIVCRFMGHPQTCKLHSIPGKVVVPIVSSPDGKPVIVNSDAIHKADVAVKAAKHAASKAQKAASSKSVVTAVNAAVAASAAATTPLMLTADALRRSGLNSASLSA
jgi:hypothetical protein